MVQNEIRTELPGRSRWKDQGGRTCAGCNVTCEAGEGKVTLASSDWTFARKHTHADSLTRTMTLPIYYVHVIAIIIIIII